MNESITFLSSSSSMPLKRCSRCRAEMAWKHLFCVACGQPSSTTTNGLPHKKTQRSKPLKVPPLEAYSRSLDVSPRVPSARKQSKTVSSKQSRAPYDHIIESIKNRHKPVPKTKLVADLSRSLMLEQHNLIGFEELDRSSNAVRYSRSAPSAMNEHIRRLPSISTLYKQAHQEDVVTHSYTDRQRRLHKPIKVIPEHDRDVAKIRQMSSPKAWLWKNYIPSTSPITSNNGDEMMESIVGIGETAIQDSATMCDDSQLLPASTFRESDEGAEPSVDRPFMSHNATEAEISGAPMVVDDASHCSQEDAYDDLASVHSEERSIVESEHWNGLEEMRDYYLTEGYPESETKDWAASISTAAPIYARPPALEFDENATPRQIGSQDDEKYSTQLSSQMTRMDINRQSLEEIRRERLAAIEAEEQLLLEQDRSALNTPSRPQRAEGVMMPAEEQSDNAILAAADWPNMEKSDSRRMLNQAVEEVEVAEARNNQELQDMHTMKALAHGLPHAVENHEDIQQQRQAALRHHEDVLLYSPFTLMEPFDGGPDERAINDAPIPCHALEETRREVQGQQLQCDTDMLHQLDHKLARFSFMREDLIRRRHHHLYQGLHAIHEGEEEEDGKKVEEEDDDWLYALIDRDDRARRNRPELQMAMNEEWLSVQPGIAYGNTDQPHLTSDLYRIQAPTSTSSPPSSSPKKHHSKIKAWPAFTAPFIPSHSDRFKANVLMSNIYMVSHQRVKAALDKLVIDHRQSVGDLSRERVESLVDAVQYAGTVREYAENVEGWIQQIACVFFEKARHQRSQAAWAVSTALEKSVEVERFFNEQLEVVKAELSGEEKGLSSFHAKAELQAVRDQACEAQKKCSEEVDRCQKEENDILEMLREEEFGLMEAIKTWRIKHATLLAKLIVDTKRVSIFLGDRISTNM